MKKLITLLFAALVAVPLMLNARQVTRSTASDVARKAIFIKIHEQVGGDINQIRPVLLDTRSFGIYNLYYVFGFEDKQAWAIISADDRHQPLIAFGTEGTFPLEPGKQSCCFRSWMDAVAATILNEINNDIQPGLKVAGDWNQYINEAPLIGDNILTTVGPLTTTLWDQGCNYNNNCPSTGGVHPAGPCDHVVTGCVATAMAQVMKYWNWPQHGQGSNSYTDPANDNDPSYGTISATFNSNYQWNNMPNTPANTSTGINLLMSHCGVSVNMNYSYSSSGAWPYGSTICADAYKDHFYYNSSAVDVKKEDYTITAWGNLMKGELNANRVICYGNSGHAWVVDGYNDNYNGTGNLYFHMNWGWSGSSNGWFSLQDAAVGTNQEAVIYIYPVPGMAPMAPVDVTASQGTYNNRVHVSWHWASNATHYKVYRNTVNSSGSAAAVTGWITQTSVDDYGVIPNHNYYYWVKSATSSAGANESGFSASALGYLNDPDLMSNETSYTISLDPNYRYVNNTYGQWAAVGVRKTLSSDDWDISIYTDDYFNTLGASSSYGSSTVDFIVFDCNHLGSGNRGIKIDRYSGTDNARAEYESYTETLIEGSNNGNYWTTGDVVEIWDVTLTPGIYKFSLDITSGTADLGIALYSSASGVYYLNRGSYKALADAGLTGTDESFTVTITDEDNYGFVVWAKDDNNAYFDIIIERAGTWKGLVNNDWHNAGNWSADVVPDATVDVTIPSGTPYNCWIYSDDAVCKSATIASGTYLRIWDETLTIQEDLDVNGQLMMDNATADAKVIVLDDVRWNSGSTAWVSDNTTIRVYGDWTFNSGAAVHLPVGSVMFYGTVTSYITCDDADCYFNFVGSYKSGGAYVGVSYLSDADMFVNGDFYIHPDAGFNIYSTKEVVVKGDLYNNGHMICNYGTFKLDGTVQDIAQNAGDYFNNLTISSSSYTMMNSNIDVNGNLLVESGVLYSNTHNLNIGGNWTNNVGVLGFNESNGRVIFDGGNYHQYCLGETFNILEVAKASGGAFRVDNGSTVICNSYDWTAGAVDVINGTFTANDLIDNGIFGAFYNNPYGVINLTNNDGYVDLDGELHLFGGYFNVYGGTSDSYWPYYSNALIEMTGGVLDFKNRGIFVYNTSYSLTENITGGTIRTVGGMRVERSEYTPSGGTTELYGTSDVTLHTISGGNIFNLTVNKAAADDNSGLFKNDAREPGITASDGPLAGNVNIDDELLIKGYFLLSAGTVEANANEITLYGNWTNNAGQASFLEETSTVWFSGSNASVINNEETFHNLYLYKTYANYDALSVNHDLHILNILFIPDGCMELNSPANLYVAGLLQMWEGAGLNANDSYGPQIFIGGNWIDDNTGNSNTYGFDPGINSTVTFNGTGTQTLTTNALYEVFNNLVINKTTGVFSTYDDITCNGNLSINQGTWDDGVTGLTHTVYDNFTVLPAGNLNTITHPNTFKFFGPDDAVIDYQSSTGYFRDIIIHKINSEDNIAMYTDHQGSQQEPADGPLLVKKITLLSPISCQFGGSLTIEEGTLDLNGNSFLGTGNVTIQDGGFLKAGNNAFLGVGTNYGLYVESGGTLEVLHSTVSHTGSGYYTVEIYSGGMISAESSHFNYMGLNGVYLPEGSIVNATHSFHDCTFQNGQSGGALFTVNNSQTLFINNAHFPANTWGSDDNAYKFFNTGHITFIGATGSFAGPAFEFDPNNRIDWLDALSASPSAIPSSVCSGSGSQLNANATGGLPGYSYSWSPATGLSATNIGNPVAIPSATTTYTVTITDSFGNIITASVTVTVNQLPVVGISSSSPNLCLGSTAVLTASGALTYLWNQGLGAGAVKTVSPVTTTVYTVTGTNAAGCSSTHSITQVVVPVPVANAGTDITIPYGASTMLNGSATGGTPAYSYAWSPAAGLSNTGIANPLANPVATTTYTLTVIDAMGCTSTDAVTVTVLPAGYYSVSGILSYDDALPNPMSNSTVVLSNAGGTVGTAMTNATGNYSFPSVSSGEYTLTGQTTKPWGGINATDALAAMKHFVHLITLTGLRLQASDVDNSGLTNSNDALMIMKRFVNIINSFPAGDWLFQVLPVSVTNANITQNIRGLCYGDLDASYVPPLTAAELISNNGMIHAADVFEFQLMAEVPAAISAVSLVLGYPDDLMDITAVKMPFDNENLFFTVSGGKLRIAWASLGTMFVTPGEQILTITARMKQNAEVPASFSPLELVFYYEMADADCHVIRPFSMSVPLVGPSAASSLALTYNNPARDMIQLGICLPEDGSLSIAILDELGRLLLAPVQGVVKTAGQHSFKISLEDLPAGTYLISAELQGEKGLCRKSGHLVVVR